MIYCLDNCTNNTKRDRLFRTLGKFPLGIANCMNGDILALVLMLNSLNLYYGYV